MSLKEYIKYLSLSIFFYLFLGIVLLLYLLGKNNLNFLTEEHFLRFDAILYQDIKNNGYHETWLCAFFPAFPFLWKLINISAIGISALNSIIFILSISTLAFYYKMDWKGQLFFLSIPSFLFMFVPYTESLFFAVGTLLIIGLKTNRHFFILLSLFLEGLIRPTTFVFIPAILGCYFFAENYLKQGLIKSIMPTLALIIGLFITISIHFFYTGKWFVFFDAQKLWKNHLHFPQLPFTSWGGDGSTRFDGSALAISILCGVFTFYLFSMKLKNKIIVSKDLGFSVLYIFLTALVVLSYRDGNLYSLNRFIYATPFFLVVLYYFLEGYKFKWNHVWLVIIISELFWLLFNSYNHIHNFLLFSTISLYFVSILLSKFPDKIISTLSFLSLITINCVGIIKLFYRYLNHGWIG